MDSKSFYDVDTGLVNPSFPLSNKRVVTNSRSHAIVLALRADAGIGK